MEARYKKELKKFGEKLRMLRKQYNYSQLDLEIRSGIDRTDISKIENGLKNIELRTIIKLANRLNIKTEEFFK